MGNNLYTSFNDLVKEHQSRVFNTVISFLQDHHDAEDVTQEVFIEVYRSLEKFKGESSISTWIYRISVNKSLDFLRKKKRLKRFGFISTMMGDPIPEENAKEPGHFDHPGILLENKEKARYLFAAIESLPENQKTAFILFNIEGLPQKEIAIVMDTSPKAVESLIQRAKAALKIKLEYFYYKRGN